MGSVLQAIPTRGETGSRLLFWGLGALVVAAPLRAYAITRVGGMNLSFFRAILLGLLLVWLAQFLPGLIRVGRERRVQLLALLVLWLLASLLVSSLGNSDVQNGVTRSLVKLLGFGLVGLLVMLVHSVLRARAVIRAFLLSALLPTMGLFWQLNNFISTGRFSVLPGSRIDASNPTAFGTLYGELPRLTSTFLEPNYMGMYFSAVVLLAIGYLAGRQRRNPFVFAILLLAIPGVVLSLSLSAFLGLTVGFGVLALLVRVRIGPLLVTGLVVVAAVVGGSYAVQALGADWNLVQLLAERVTGRLAGEGGAFFGRGRFFLAAINGFYENPFFGAGIGLLRDDTGQLVLSGHSAYLTVLGEQGLFGFVPLIVLLGSVVVWLKRNVGEKLRVGDKSGAFLLAGLLASLVSLMVSNLAYDAMFSFDSAWLILALSAAAAAEDTPATGSGMAPAPAPLAAETT